MAHKRKHEETKPLVLSDTNTPPAPEEEAAETWESLALLFSCGGVYIPPPPPEDAPYLAVHTPGQTAYLLRDDDPASCLAMDESLKDERRFCESVSRLLHNPSDLRQLINEEFLWNQN